MKRRNALVSLLVLGLAARTAPAVAQSERRPYRIGLLPDLDENSRRLFTAALERNRWSEGRDFVLVEPEAPPAIRMRMVPSPAKEANTDIAGVTRTLLARNPDVVLATSTAYAAAAQHASSTVPVVMWTSGYPVEAGIAQSLAKPGRNVTGNSIYAGTGMWGKLLELIKEADPAIVRATVLWDYVPPAFSREEIEPAHAELRRAAAKLGLELQIAEVAHPAQVKDALARAQEHGAAALVVTSGWALASARHDVMQFATERRMPVITDFRWPASVRPYPLLVYAVPQADLMQTAADYTLHILQGARPAELPIQQPRRFEFVVNLQTAKALGLAVPQALRLRADEVIE